MENTAVAAGPLLTEVELQSNPNETRFSRGAGIAAMAVAAAVLIGWTFHIGPLKQLAPGLVAMNPLTAVAFLAAGWSLLSLLAARSTKHGLLAAQPAAWLVLLIGALKLLALWGGPDVHLDQWLFHSQLDNFARPNRMAPNTALNFCLLGGALLFMEARPRLAVWAAQVLALLLAMSSLLALLGYAYGLSSFYGIGQFIPMALHTALTFVLLAAGLLAARPSAGLMRPLSSRSTGGIMARRLLPAAILVPALGGWLRLMGQRLNLFDYEFGVALLVVGNMLVFATLIWVNAGLLRRLDRARQQAEAQVRAASAALEESHQVLLKKNAEMEADLGLAREIQQAFLPQQYITLPRAAPPAESALRFYHRYLSTATLGGDFSDILVLTDEKAGIFICDVMGHGVRSALVTAVVRGLVEETLTVAHDPGRLLTAINRGFIAILQRTRTPLFATAFYACTDLANGELHYASAGHPSPLLVCRRGGAVRPLLAATEATGPALGVFDDARYTTHRCALEPGHFVVFYTDGVVEVADNNGEEFGEERLQRVIEQALGQPPAALLDAVLQAATAFAAAGQFMDDVCLVGMEVARCGSVNGAHYSEDTGTVTKSV